MIRRYFFAGTLLGWVVAAGAGSASGQVTFRIVSYMSQYGQPSGITEGSPGVFYFNAGTAPPAVFSVTTQGTKTLLASLTTGQIIQNPPVSGADTRLYSAYQQNVTSASLFSVGAQPGKKVYTAQGIAPFLTQNLPDADLLGTGGAFSDGALYLINASTSGGVKTIYQFPSTEILPNTAIYASDGNYYGVSYLQDGSGYVFRVTPSGTRTNLVTFPSSTFGYSPHWVPLLQGSDGNLYGATPIGGTNGTGTIYKLTLSGQYTLLYTFPKGTDYNPTALIEGSDGNLYGATWAPTGFSLLFEVTPAGQYTPLYTMTSVACQCQLTQGSDGNIYGTAQVGGPVGGGAVFALDVGLPKPAPRAQHFSPQSGAPGTSVRIWGYNLLSATVAFNGIAAAETTASGPNYIWATVPAGASTGPITITTPGGSITTSTSFTVQ